MKTRNRKPIMLHAITSLPVSDKETIVDRKVERAFLQGLAAIPPGSYSPAAEAALEQRLGWQPQQPRPMPQPVTVMDMDDEDELTAADLRELKKIARQMRRR